MGVRVHDFHSHDVDVREGREAAEVVGTEYRMPRMNAYQIGNEPPADGTAWPPSAQLQVSAIRLNVDPPDTPLEHLTAVFGALIPSG